MLIAAFILMTGILFRLVPHEPNFTPVLALALFGGMYLRRPWSVLVPVMMVAVTDFFLGWHATVPWTWGSLLLIAVAASNLRRANSMLAIAGGSIAAAVVFFLVTNFGVWIVYYPKTMEGLTRCYTLALPFFRNTLISTLLYTTVFVALYELSERLLLRPVRARKG